MLDARKLKACYRSNS